MLQLGGVGQDKIRKETNAGKFLRNYTKTLRSVYVRGEISLSLKIKAGIRTLVLLEGFQGYLPKLLLLTINKPNGGQLWKPGKPSRSTHRGALVEPPKESSSIETMRILK